VLNELKSKKMKEKRISNFNGLGDHSILTLTDIQVSYWNVHSFCDDEDDNHGVDAYFKWNDDVFFIQVLPSKSVTQNLGIYIKASSTLGYIDFLSVVENRVTQQLFENEVIKVCKKIGLNNDYQDLKKMYSPSEKYKEIDIK